MINFSLFRPILIKFCLNKKKLSSQVIIIGELSAIGPFGKNRYFGSILDELKKKNFSFEEIKISSKNIFLNFKFRNYNFIESYLSFFDFFRAFFLKNKLIKDYIIYNQNSKLFELKIKLYYFMFRRLFLKNQTKLVLVSEHYSTEYAAIIAAKELGIKTIEIQHGIIHGNHPNFVISNRWKKKYILPNVLITYGVYEKQLLSSLNIWENTLILPLGVPRYDFLRTYSINRRKILSKFNIPQGKKILFWPTQTHDKLMARTKENNLNADVIFKTISKKEDWFLLIKFHPGENKKESMAFYNNYKKKYNLSRVEIIDYSKISTYDLILISNCVILKHSTVGKEAILLNKPIINLELMKSWCLDEYKELKSSFIIKKEEELVNVLNSITTNKYMELFKKERKKYMQKHFCNFGCASNKIANNIIKISDLKNE
jgi:hypothetical protein